MLEINNLCKKFKKKEVLDNLNLKIEDNEIFGFVGPNGAGKTTTMRIIAGLLIPDSGDVNVYGYDAILQADKVKSIMGYMPDFFGSYPNLTTMEYMEYYTSLYGMIGDDIKRRCNELLEIVNLGDKRDVFVDNMSRGMKQRLCMARCLIHDPKLLILDEPASGLDPRARYDMKEIMKNLKQLGKTVIISSHILPELAEMTTTIGIIEGGKIVTKGTMEEISKSMNRKVRTNINVYSNIDMALNILKNDQDVSSISIDENLLSFDFEGDEKMNAILFKKMIENDVLISSFYQEKADLEELFIEITKKD